MKIVNIDAPKELVWKVDLRFILDVIKPLEEKYYGCLACMQMECSFNRNNTSTVSLPTFPIRMFSECLIGYENIATLIHTIPIYLRDNKPEIKDESGIIEKLGAYYPIVPNNPNIKRDSPYIELFLTPISVSTNGNDTHFRWLLTKVLLHELAHAAMDIYNIESTRQKKELVTYTSDFGRWREESMANAIALRIIKDYGKKRFYNYAKEYIRSQDPKYALGVLLEDFDYWDFREIIESKINGVNSDLQQKWLKYVQGDPTAEGLKEWNEALSSKFAYIFNDKLYSKEKDLVFDIVKDVLTNYQATYGKKMDFGTFSSIFPNIKTGGVMSYKPSINGEPNSTYPLKVDLNGIDYSLYFHWDHETLYQFVANSGCKFDEYQNY